MKEFLNHIFISFGLISEGTAGSDQAKKVVLAAEIIIVCAIAFLWWLSTRESSDSAFRVREVDLKKAKNIPSESQDNLLASARMKPTEKKSEPLRLEGIRIDGAPHEVLGIALRATEIQVQSAYRELMKQYHPDKVGRPGTREWLDAQKIAEALNRARQEMLKQIQSQSPNRSGR